eukprot:2077-Chlamydomonas_euryale.AAC.6
MDDDDEDNPYLRVNLRRIRELTASGGQTTNQVNSLASQDFAWDTPTNVSIPDPDGNAQEALRVSYTALFDIGGTDVPFTMTTLLFSGAWNVSYGSGFVSGPDNSVKVQFTIGGDTQTWPWLTADGYVELEFRVAWNRLFAALNGTVSNIGDISDDNYTYLEYDDIDTDDTEDTEDTSTFELEDDNDGATRITTPGG